MAELKHFLQFNDFNRDEFDYLFQRTKQIKDRFKSYQQYWPLVDRTLVMIFEKASTRTRLSFEAGMETISGSCRVRLQGQTEWQTYGAGQSFKAPGNSSFDIEVSGEPYQYVCYYG